MRWINEFGGLTGYSLVLVQYIGTGKLQSVKGLLAKAVGDLREFTVHIILKVVCHLNTIAQGLQLIQQSYSRCKFYLRLTDNTSHLHLYPYNPR